MTEVNSNIDVVIYALGLLGGATKKVATEEIAYKAFLLAPDRFSWVDPKYVNFPDKEVARSALEDSAKEKNGILAEGNSARETAKDGWTLTSSGLAWFQENRQRIEKTLGIKSVETPHLSTKEIQRLRARITKEPAFLIFQSKKSLSEVTSFMFTDMLQCPPDAAPSFIKIKFEKLMNSANLAREGSLIHFLSECEKKFGYLFHSLE